MNTRIVFRILAAILLVALLAGFGVMAYNAGIARGMAAGGSLPAPSAPGAPYPYFGYGPFFPHWGFGFFPFGFLFPLLGFFLFFGLIRVLLFPRWGGPRHHGWNGMHQVPPPFEEWHRKAHEAEEKQA